MQYDIINMFNVHVILFNPYNYNIGLLWPWFAFCRGCVSGLEQVPAGGEDGQEVLHQRVQVLPQRVHLQAEEDQGVVAVHRRGRVGGRGAHGKETKWNLYMHVLKG